MSRKLSALVDPKNVGSVLDVYPASDYKRFLPKGGIASRIGSHFQRTGQYLNHAIESSSGRAAGSAAHESQSGVLQATHRQE